MASPCSLSDAHTDSRLYLCLKAWHPGRERLRLFGLLCVSELARISFLDKKRNSILASFVEEIIEQSRGVSSKNAKLLKAKVLGLTVGAGGEAASWPANAMFKDCIYTLTFALGVRGCIDPKSGKYSSATFSPKASAILSAEHCCRAYAEFSAIAGAWMAVTESGIAGELRRLGTPKLRTKLVSALADYGSCYAYNYLGVKVLGWSYQECSGYASFLCRVNNVDPVQDVDFLHALARALLNRFRQEARAVAKHAYWASHESARRLAVQRLLCAIERPETIEALIREIWESIICQKSYCKLEWAKRVSLGH